MFAFMSQIYMCSFVSEFGIEHVESAPNSVIEYIFRSFIIIIVEIPRPFI